MQRRTMWCKNGIPNDKMSGIEAWLEYVRDKHGACSSYERNCVLTAAAKELGVIDFTEANRRLGVYVGNYYEEIECGWDLPSGDTGWGPSLDMSKPLLAMGARLRLGVEPDAR